MLTLLALFKATLIFTSLCLFGCLGHEYAERGNTRYILMLLITSAMLFVSIAMFELNGLCKQREWAARVLTNNPQPITAYYLDHKDGTRTLEYKFNSEFKP